MKKCISCGKENSGLICSHCLAKGATNAGIFVKTATATLPAILAVLIFKKR